MSRERFDWLSNVAGEVISTPGSESNVKEIFDKSWELKRTRENIAVFNQFDEFGNHLFHYEVTGKAMEEVLQKTMQKEDKYRGIVLTSGSSGTMGCGDYLKELYPHSKLAVGEALQCPTLLMNGFGAHRIEGIGDKHVPWIHHVKNTDMVIGIDDTDTMALLRLFNEPRGRQYLVEKGVPESFVKDLSLLGISGIANIIGAIKFAKYYELTKNDIILTVLTDSMELYQSRLEQMRKENKNYTEMDAAIAYQQHLKGISTDSMEELDYIAKKRIHNLKYYTWIEQQGKDLEELNNQWLDDEHYWQDIHQQAIQIDHLIDSFNHRTGLIKTL